MIQSPAPHWPRPRSWRAHLRRCLALLVVARDHLRGFTDADLASYDTKVRLIEKGEACEFTQAEFDAAESRRRSWGRK